MIFFLPALLHIVFLRRKNPSKSWNIYLNPVVKLKILHIPMSQGRGQQSWPELGMPGALGTQPTQFSGLPGAQLESGLSEVAR